MKALQVLLIAGGAALGGLALLQKKEGGADFEFSQVAFRSMAAQGLSYPASVTAAGQTGLGRKATIVASGTLVNTGQVVRDVLVRLRTVPQALAGTASSDVFTALAPGGSRAFQVQLVVEDQDAQGAYQAVLDLVDSASGKVYAMAPSIPSLVTVRPLRRVQFTQALLTTATKNNLSSPTDSAVVTIQGQIKNTGNLSATVAVVGWNRTGGTALTANTDLQALAPGAVRNFTLSFTVRGSDPPGDYAFQVEVVDEGGSNLLGEDAYYQPAPSFLQTPTIVSVSQAAFAFTGEPVWGVSLGAAYGPRASTRIFRL